MPKLAVKKAAAAAFVLADDQKVSLAVQMVDDVGNPVAPATGTIVWSVSDPSILALTTNADGTAMIASTAKLGTSQVGVQVSDPNNPNNPPMTGTLDITVSTSAATGVTIMPGAPTHI